jgi:hypothetical protein
MNEVCELTEMELEAVSGGDFNVNVAPHIDIIAPVNVGFGGFAISLFGNATGGNGGGQTLGNFSFG